MFFELQLEVGVPSSCHVDLRVLLMVPIGSQCWGFSPWDLEMTNLKEGHLDL